MFDLNQPCFLFVPHLLHFDYNLSVQMSEPHGVDPTLLKEFA